MERVAELYQWLATGPSPACDQILAAGLECAEPAYRQRIVPMLFERGTEAAWAGLVANYDLLSADERQRLTARQDMLRAGVAVALGRPEPRARVQALGALTDHPAPGLAYLLPDVLRSTSSEVRHAAGTALRCLAQQLADEHPQPDWDEDRRRTYAHSRSEMAKALRTALRTFDLHYCHDAIEVSLWFAADLGEELWRLLTNRRLQCGNIVSAQLKAWNSPRLAHFLLVALQHGTWRLPAQQMLRAWSRPEQVAAVLRCGALLDDPGIRQCVAGLKRPHWFDHLQRDLGALPPDLRTAAPRWLCCLGFEEIEQADLLCRWLSAPDREIQRACVYAMASLNTPQAMNRLAQLAEGRSVLATFARWFLAGQAAAGDGAVPAPGRSRPGRASPETFDSDPLQPDGPGEEELPQFARPPTGRTGEDAEFIALVRENLDVCGREVLTFLRSANVEDRLLGLRILAGVDGEAGFAEEVEHLLVDSEAAVRELACEVLKIPGQLRPGLGADEEEDVAVPPPPPTPAPSPTPTELRRELRQTMARLLVNEPDAETTVALVRQIQTLLRRLPPNASGVRSGDTEVHE